MSLAIVSALPLVSAGKVVKHGVLGISRGYRGDVCVDNMLYPFTFLQHFFEGANILISRLITIMTLSRLFP